MRYITYVQHKWFGLYRPKRKSRNQGVPFVSLSTVIVIFCLFNPILHGGGSNGPPWQFFDRGSSGNASNELIFHDFVPFNNQQDLAKPFFRFFFQILEKFCLEGTWSPKILTQNLENSKKIQFFYNKSYFF